jgi:hypothetical protein
MRNKDNKKLEFRAGKAGKSFTEERLISHTGLTVVRDYVCSQSLARQLNRVFETVKTNASRFCNVQILMSWKSVFSLVGFQKMKENRYITMLYV